jgi:hypothetical protein
MPQQISVAGGDGSVASLKGDIESETCCEATIEPTNGMVVPFRLLRLARSGREFAFSEFGDKQSHKVVFYLHG